MLSNTDGRLIRFVEITSRSESYCCSYGNTLAAVSNLHYKKHLKESSILISSRIFVYTGISCY